MVSSVPLTLSVTTGLCEMVPMDHVEGLVEAVRVFGNLTHFKEVRDILTKNQGK